MCINKSDTRETVKRQTDADRIWTSTSRKRKLIQAGGSDVGHGNMVASRATAQKEPFKKQSYLQGPPLLPPPECSPQFLLQVFSLLVKKKSELTDM